MKTIKNAVMGGFLLIVSLVMASAAYAQMIQGEVAEVIAQESSFRIIRMDPESKAAEPESIKVNITSQTQLEGLAGLDELRAGDEVWADVELDPVTQNWLALKVRLDKVDIRDPGDAAAAAAASSYAE